MVSRVVVVLHSSQDCRSRRQLRTADRLLSHRRALTGVNRSDSARALTDAQIGARGQDELGINEKISFVHVTVGVGQEFDLPLGGIANGGRRIAYEATGPL